MSRRLLALLSSFSLILALSAVPVLADHNPADGPEVDGVAVDGNPSCPSGTTETKLEPVTAGTFPGAFSSSIQIILQSQNRFTFIITGALAEIVIVKGGPNANVYDYPSPGIAHDDGLHAPNRTPGAFYGLSHISFCLVQAPPDVSVVKTPDGESTPPGTIEAGDTATFTISVTSNGPGPADNVTLDDDLPSGFTWTEASDASNSCQVGLLDADAAQDLKCNFGTLAAGQVRTVSVSAPTSSATCGTINNTAFVSATNDSNASNNSDPGSIIVLCPNVTVEKSGNGPINAGQTATFSITVTNEGPGAASNVTLSDTLPDSGLNWSETSDPANACSVSALPAPQTLSCSFGTLAEGATRTVSVSTSTDTSDCGTLSNTVTISATGDISATDNTSTATLDVLCGAIRIAKNSTKGGPVANAGAVFSVDGPDEGTGADFSVTDDDTAAAPDEDDDIGEVCVSGLIPGATYTVNETSPPSGYGAATQTNVTVVAAAGSCSSTSLNTATFVNAPLFDIQVNFADGGSGETSIVSITCDGDSTLDGTSATGWDDSLTITDIAFVDEDAGTPTEMTIDCTLVVDP